MGFCAYEFSIGACKNVTRIGSCVASARILKHLLATESCQAHSEDAYYGHLVLRLMASFVLFYTSRVVCKGRLTMEEIIFSLKHYWRFVDMKPLGLQALL